MIQNDFQEFSNLDSCSLGFILSVLLESMTKAFCVEQLIKIFAIPSHSCGAFKVNENGGCKKLTSLIFMGNRCNAMHLLC